MYGSYTYFSLLIWSFNCLSRLPGRLDEGTSSSLSASNTRCKVAHSHLTLKLRYCALVLERNGETGVQTTAVTQFQDLSIFGKGRTVRKVMGGMGDFQLARLFVFAHCLCRNFFAGETPLQEFFFRQILLYMSFTN